MTMLDEFTLRCQDFHPGSLIRLADGQRWTFPAAPGRVTPGGAVPGGEAGFGRDYAATVAAVREAEDEAELLRAELALAICLLGRNYDLTPAALFDLLGHAPGVPALTATQEAFHRVALDHVRRAGASADTTPHEPRVQVVPATPKPQASRKRFLSAFLHHYRGRI
jgi:hypothetical protein